MRRLAIIVFTISVAFGIFFGIFAWFSDDLYIRVPEAQVEYQGVPSPESLLYRSRNGTYMLFPAGHDSHFPVYVIVTDNANGTKYVGTLASEDPYKNILQWKLRSFAICLNCETYLGFPDNFQGTAGISGSPDVVHFRVYQDNVTIRF